MNYPMPVELDALPPYVQGKLQTLKYGEKGKLAAHIGVKIAQLSHFINGERPIPQKYIPGILSFFDERINLQIVNDKTGEVKQ